MKQNMFRQKSLVFLVVTTSFLHFRTEAVLAQSSNCVEASKLFRNGVSISDASQEEESYYRRAIELCPTMAEASFNLGVILSRKGRSSEALEYFEKAVSVSKRADFYTAVGNIKVTNKAFLAARSSYEKAIEVDPGYVPALLGLGIVFDNLGEFSKAEEALRKAAAISRSDPVVQYNLGVVLERQNRSQEAIVAYENAVRVDDQHFSSHFQLGLAYQNAGRFEDSRKVLERAASLQPDNPEVHRALGVAYDKLGAYDRAELAFRRVLKLSPNDIVSKINLGVVLMSRPAPNPLEAEKILTEALKQSPKNSKALTALGWSQIELGRHAMAEDTLRQSIEIDSADALAHNNLGVLYLRTGRNQDAHREFERALALNPDLLEARRNLRQFGE